MTNEVIELTQLVPRIRDVYNPKGDVNENIIIKS